MLISSFMYDDGVFGDSREARLMGPGLGRGPVTVEIYRKGEKLHSWTIPGELRHRRLKNAIEHAGLVFYWECPGKNLSAGRPHWDAYVALSSLYNDLTGDSLTDWLEENKYEYEFDTQIQDSHGTVYPVIATALSDGAWFRITYRFKLSNDKKHQRDDLVLTRDYSSAMNTTLTELMKRMLDESESLLRAAMTIDAKPAVPKDYRGIANQVFGYRKGK